MNHRWKTGNILVVNLDHHFLAHLVAVIKCLNAILSPVLVMWRGRTMSRGSRMLFDGNVEVRCGGEIGEENNGASTNVVGQFGRDT